MIPKTIHQIWVGPNKIPTREQGFIEKLKDMHPTYTYHLWTDDNILVDELPQHLQEQYIKLYSDKQYAFCADILRWVVVYRWGGWYADVDFDMIQSLDVLGERGDDGILLYHPNAHPADFTIVNGAFAFKENHPITEFMVNAMGYGYFYGPEFCGRTIKEYLLLPYVIPHALVKNELAKENVWFYDWEDFNENICRHYSLYSWGLEYIVEQ